MNHVLCRLHASNDRELANTDLNPLHAVEKRAERRLTSARDAHRNLQAELSTIIASVAASGMTLLAPVFAKTSLLMRAS